MLCCLVDGCVLYGDVVVASFDGDGSLDSESCGSLCGHVIEDCVCDGDVASAVDPEWVSCVVVD